jgi:hypothetical protein
MRLLSALAVLVLSFPAEAQNWPERSITLIVPFAPGGAADGIARIVSDAMAQRLGQSVVVENVGGAGGTLGTARVKNATADGHTIGLGHVGTIAAAVALYRRLPYDPRADFVPVAWLASAPLVLSVRKDLPVKDLKEFIAYARQQGDKITNGNAGVGSIAHVSCAYLAALAGLPPTEVPYKGNGPMMNEPAGWPARLFLRPASGRQRPHQLGPDQGARRRRRAPLAGGARGADLDRGGAAGMAGQCVDGPVRAQERAARRPGEAARRGVRRCRRSARAQAAGRAGCGSADRRGARARALLRLRQRRDRALGQDHPRRQDSVLGLSFLAMA